VVVRLALVVGEQAGRVTPHPLPHLKAIQEEILPVVFRLPRRIHLVVEEVQLPLESLALVLPVVMAVLEPHLLLLVHL
jgi:hypothetical protein